MKRIIPVLLLICMVCFGGCTESKEVIGSAEIETLRSEAAAYESGRYFIKNIDSGVLEQVFSFYFDEEERQVYLCEGNQAGVQYAEYSNGVELFREEDGVSENVPSADETYARYTKKEPHPYSTGQLFFYIKSYVETSEQVSDEDGNTVYIHRYNVEKLNRALESPVSEFITYYAFDAEGKFVYFCQHNVSADSYYEDGTPVSYTYEITLAEVNAISDIENPITVE